MSAGGDRVLCGGALTTATAPVAPVAPVAATAAAAVAVAPVAAYDGQWLWLYDGRTLRAEHGVRRWHELPEQRSLHDPQPASGSHLGHELCGSRLMRLELVLFDARLVPRRGWSL